MEIGIFSPWELGGGLAVALLIVKVIMDWIDRMRSKDRKYDKDMLDSGIEYGQIGERRSSVLTDEDLTRIEKVVWGEGCGRDVTTKLYEMHKWHDVVDEDGVRVWYVRRSFEQAMIDLTQAIRDSNVQQALVISNIARQSALLEKLIDRD